MGFNCLKARATSRRQFTFYHLVPRSSWYSFYRPREDERLSRPWSHPVVLNTGPLVWETSALTTRPLLHKKGVSKKQYTSQLILGNQGMCPQYSYYKTFTSHKNWSSPLQEFFTKIPQLWPVVFSVNLKIRALTPRSSHQGKKLYKKDVCKNFAKFTHRKTPVPESLF